jgi:integrase
VGALMRAIGGYEGSLTVRSALRLAPLVFVRPGELRKAEWTAMDRELKPVTGRGRYVFWSGRSSQRPMSDNAILAAMRRMGIAKEEMSGHGFRAMARTILDEVLGFRPDFIEHQLAHAVRDPNGRAYNRTAHLEERRKMMQAWADYLDRLKNGADVIPILKAG